MLVTQLASLVRHVATVGGETPSLCRTQPPWQHANAIFQAFADPDAFLEEGKRAPQVAQAAPTVLEASGSGCWWKGGSLNRALSPEFD
jgi:hypothetical protein